MSNSVQNYNQHFTNAAFASLFDSITAKLPSLTFWAIVFSYLATAGLNCYAIHLPLFLSVPLAIAIQALRFLCVFTPFLNPSGKASHLPEFIAVCASLLALFELSFSLQAMGETENNFWSLFLFGAAILVLSMVLELQFISAGKRAFGMTTTRAIQGAVMNQTQQPTLPAVQAPQIDLAALQSEIEYLRNQVNAKTGKKSLPVELLTTTPTNGKESH